MKLLADSSTGELIGGAVVGPEAVEIIHEVVVAMNFKATASEFLKIPHYHPTLSEIWDISSRRPYTDPKLRVSLANVLAFAIDYQK